MLRLPDGFDELARALPSRLEGVEGHLSDREARLLALFAAVPTAEGEILEIGSFKGRSTIVLASASALAGDARVHAIDPLTSPSVTDPSLRGAQSGKPDFERNLKAAGVTERVAFHQDFSTNVAPSWTTPLRLLWIDGDHTLRGARADVQGFAHHLADGGIIAFHDVLHLVEGPARSFGELLAQPGWGAAGLCGSIGWAQRTGDAAAQAAHAGTRRDLSRRLLAMASFLAGDRRPAGLARLRWKLARALVPHDERPPGDLLGMLVSARA